MPTIRQALRAAGCLALLGLAAGPLQAAAEEPAPTEIFRQLSSERELLVAEVGRLDAELQGLRQLAQASGGDIAPTQAARFELRMNELEEALRRTTGKVETFDFRLQQLDTRITAIDERLKSVERSLVEAERSAEATPEAAASETAPAEAESAEETAAFVAPESGSAVELPNGPPEDQYGFAFELLRQGRYVDAQSALEQFLEGNAKHDLAGNAKYWLGETFYVRGDYQSSALIFAEGYREYPDSQKAPDNLLKLGMSLVNLGDMENACGTFSELLRIYPRAASSIRTRAERELQSEACQ